MRRPAEPNLRPAAAGTAEAQQPDRDLAEPGQTHEISGVNVQGVESGEGARCRPGPMRLRLADQSHCLLLR